MYLEHKCHVAEGDEPYVRGLATTDGCRATVSLRDWGY